MVSLIVLLLNLIGRDMVFIHLKAITLVGPPREIFVIDPLAVQHLNNLSMNFLLFSASIFVEKDKQQLTSFNTDDTCC